MEQVIPLLSASDRQLPSRRLSLAAFVEYLGIEPSLSACKTDVLTSITSTPSSRAGESNSLYRDYEPRLLTSAATPAETKYTIWYHQVVTRTPPGIRTQNHGCLNPAALPFCLAGRTLSQIRTGSLRV